MRRNVRSVCMVSSRVGIKGRTDPKGARERQIIPAVAAALQGTERGKVRLQLIDMQCSTACVIHQPAPTENRSPRRVEIPIDVNGHGFLI
jgi:hypothetical protein